MLKRLLILLAVVGVVMVLASAAMAQNVPSGSGPTGACGHLGTCFVPLFSAVGERVVYKGSGGATAEAADSCTSGDTYKLVLRSSTSTEKKRVIFTSTGEGLDCNCSGGPHPGAVSLSVAGATHLKLKAIALEGVIPAGAYVDMSGSDWVQKQGSDACGLP